MNIFCLKDWLEPNLPQGVSLLIGEWADNEVEGRKKFLSIGFEGGGPPGPADRTVNLKLWYASPRNGSTAQNGQLDAYSDVVQIDAFLAELTADRPFANIVPITGIIGPTTAEGGRLCYQMNVQITI